MYLPLRKLPSNYRIITYHSNGQICRFFERLKAENELRRHSSEKEKGLANETKEGPDDGMLEFPSRRLSVSSKSETSSVISENYANAKDMWKKRESAVNNAPVLPPGYLREQKSRNNSLKVVTDNATIDSSTSPRNSRNFWKQRDSGGGSGKIPIPSNYSRQNSMSRQNSLSRQTSTKSRGDDSETAQIRKRLSIDGISIPVVDIPKPNDNDSFDMPDSTIPLEEIISRRTSMASISQPHTPTLSSARGSPSGGRLSPASSLKVSPQSPRRLTASPSFMLSSSTKTESSTKATPGQSTLVESSPMQLFSPGFDAFDPERVFDDDCPIVLIEIGESEARMGLWNVKKRCFELSYDIVTVYKFLSLI